MKSLLFTVGLLCVGAVACSPSGGGDYETLFPASENSPISIRYDSLRVDTLRPDSIATSFKGLTCLYRDSIYFVDQLYGWLYRFTPDGHLAGRCLGQGRSNREIPTKLIDGYTISPDGFHCFLGSTHDGYVYDRNVYLHHRFRIIPAEQESCPVWERFSTYSLTYSDLIPRLIGDRLYLNVTAGSPDFNPSHRNYLHNARILMCIDARTGEVESLLGRYSPAVGYMTAFRGCSYDITPANEFYVGYETDSVIYVYDGNYRALRAFGYAGKGMDTNYLTLEPGPHYKTQAAAERRAKGYYTSLRYIDGYLFRTYQRNGKADRDGLQIYDGSTLIADVDVPKGMRVVGYIAPYYYSQVMADEDRETLTLYRFKLD